jgi:hypothetical protein
MAKTATDTETIVNENQLSLHTYARILAETRGVSEADQAVILRKYGIDPETWPEVAEHADQHLTQALSQGDQGAVLAFAQAYSVAQGETNRVSDDQPPASLAEHWQRQMAVTVGSDASGMTAMWPPGLVDAIEKKQWGKLAEWGTAHEFPVKGSAPAKETGTSPLLEKLARVLACLAAFPDVQPSEILRKLQWQWDDWQRFSDKAYQVLLNEMALGSESSKKVFTETFATTQKYLKENNISAESLDAQAVGVSPS